MGLESEEWNSIRDPLQRARVLLEVPKEAKSLRIIDVFLLGVYVEARG